MRAALRRERRSFAMHLAEAHDSAGPKLVERLEQVEADLHYLPAGTEAAFTGGRATTSPRGVCANSGDSPVFRSLQDVSLFSLCRVCLGIAP